MKVDCYWCGRTADPLPQGKYKCDWCMVIFDGKKEKIQIQRKTDR